MSTAVFFHAHPDDESIATSGTMMLAAEAGWRVVLVLGTRGEHGEPVDGVLDEGEPLGSRREAETRRSAEIIGAHRVEFLGYTDSGMIGEPTNDEPDCFWQADVEEAATRLAAILNDERAEVLTVYDDHGGYGHPDHIQVHRVGVRAAEIAGVDRVYESTMNRDRIRESFAQAEAEGLEIEGAEERREQMESEDDPFGTPEAIITHGVDVTAVLARKRQSMLAHESQIGPDSFFLKMPDELFAGAFGMEWFIERGRPRHDEPLRTSILSSS